MSLIESSGADFDREFVKYRAGHELRQRAAALYNPALREEAERKEAEAVRLYDLFAQMKFNPVTGNRVREFTEALREGMQKIENLDTTLNRFTLLSPLKQYEEYLEDPEGHKEGFARGIITAQLALIDPDRRGHTAIVSPKQKGILIRTHPVEAVQGQFKKLFGLEEGLLRDFGLEAAFEVITPDNRAPSGALSYLKLGFQKQAAR